MVGCHGRSPGSDNAVPAALSSQPAVIALSVRVHFPKERLIAGEPIDVHVIVTNESTESIQIWETRPEWMVWFKLADDQGNKVSLTRYGERMKSIKGLTVTPRVRRPLDPQQQASYRLRLSRLHDLTLPGTYHGVAYFQSGGPTLVEPVHESALWTIEVIEDHNK